MLFFRFGWYCSVAPESGHPKKFLLSSRVEPAILRPFVRVTVAYPVPVGRSTGKLGRKKNAENVSGIWFEINVRFRLARRFSRALPSSVADCTANRLLAFVISKARTSGNHCGNGHSTEKISLLLPVLLPRASSSNCLIIKAAVSNWLEITRKVPRMH